MTLPSKISKKLYNITLYLLDTITHILDSDLMPLTLDHGVIILILKFKDNTCIDNIN